MIYFCLVGVGVFVVGVGVGYGLATGRRRDLLAEALAARARDRTEGLPEPTDEEVRQMVAAAMLAQEETPFAYPTLALGTALLRRRGAGEGLPNGGSGG